MDLTIDFGTSSGKLGFFEKDNLVEKVAGIRLNDLSDALRGKDIQNVIVSSVSENSQDIIKHVNASQKSLILDPTLSLPIKLEYSTPHTLGTDRIAAVAGAYSLYPGKDILVIRVL